MGEALEGRLGAFMVIVQVIVGGLLLGAIYALFSSGLTLIWGMMNFINFAHGEFAMLGMYVAFLVVMWLHGGPPVFTPAAALALFVLGVGIYGSARDFERYAATAVAFIRLAMIRVMLRRLAPNLSLWIGTSRMGFKWIQGTLRAIGRCCRGPLMANGRGAWICLAWVCCKR